MYKIVCSRPPKQVWNLSASEVSQDQQFWDATVHLPMSLILSAGTGSVEPQGGPVSTAGANTCK